MEVLDSFRDFSDVPVKRVLSTVAKRASPVISIIALLSVPMVILVLLFVPATYQSSTVVSSVMMPGYSCSMIAAVTNLSVYTFGTYGTLEEGIRSVFASTHIIGDPCVLTGSQTATLCDYQQPVILSALPFSNTVNNPPLSYTHVLYATYEDCLRDLSLGISCSSVALWSTNSLNTIYCKYGTKGITIGPITSNPSVQGVTGPVPAVCTPPMTSPSGIQDLTPLANAIRVSSAFSPEAVCIAFKGNANPPFVCTTTNPMPILSILAQAAGVYGGVISALSFLVLASARCLEPFLCRRVSPIGKASVGNEELDATVSFTPKALSAPPNGDDNVARR